MKIFLKLSLLLFASVAVFSSALAQNKVMATMKPGAAAGEVDIFIRPSYNSGGTEYLVNLIISVGVKTSCYTTAPTATLTYFGTTGLSWNPGTVITGGSAYLGLSGYAVYTFNGSNTNTTPTTLTNNTELKMATVKFTGGGPNCQVYLMNHDLLASRTDYFYMTTNTSGAVVFEEEGQESLNVYASAGNSSVEGDGFAGLSTDANISLPFSLSSFSATKQNAGVKLDWTTASEINTAYFQVEHSLDGNSFTAINKPVNATGTSDGYVNYTDYHENPPAGINYYRLRMVDRDGKEKFSPVRMIRLGNESGKLQVFPTLNKTGIVYVQLPTGGELATIRLTNTSGQELSQRMNTTKGLNREANLQGLPAGIYFIHVQDAQNGKKESFRIFYQ